MSTSEEAMNVYLDDIRIGPAAESDEWGFQSDNWHTWVIVRHIDNAKVLLEAGLVEDMSLDHDLGEHPTGYDLVKYMVETGNWPKGVITIHSANPVGAKNMKSLIDNATKHGLRDK